MERFHICCIYLASLAGGCELDTLTSIESSESRAASDVIVAQSATTASGQNTSQEGAQATVDTLSADSLDLHPASPPATASWTPLVGAGFFDDLTTAAADVDVGSLGLTDPVLSSDSGEFSDDSSPAFLPAGASFHTVAQDPGLMLPEYVRDLGVLVVRDFTLPAGVTLKAKGSLPLVIAATGDIIIEGILDAGAEPDDPSGDYQVQAGPGGYNGSWPLNDPSSYAWGPGSGLSVSQLGGSGAGYLNPGGAGSEGQNSGGPASITALFPLRGGAGGGVGGSGNLNHGRGGGGGGAVYLVAQGRIRIGTSGDAHSSSGINLPGGGSFNVPGSGGRGSGGGAGGTLLLDAPTITVYGTLAANGGGGTSMWDVSARGNRGNFSAVPAEGTLAQTGPPLRRGGDGGTGDIPAADGAEHSGGGGSAGRLYLRGETVTIDAGALLSPSQATAGVTLEVLDAP